jgi:hypothetical protein
VRALTYLLYILAWEGMVWGGFVWLVIAHQWSAWWCLLAILLSAGACTPEKWKALTS